MRARSDRSRTDDTLLDPGSHRGFLILLKAVIAVMVIAQIGLAFRSDRLLLARPFIEDSFYSLSVARSIGEGHGFTIDGVNPTNGVQPLICLLYAPIYALSFSDPHEALRPIYLLQCVIALLLAATCATLMARLDRSGGRNPLRWWTAFASVYVNYTLSIHVLNGLESGLTSLMIVVALLLFKRFRSTRSTALWRWGLFGAFIGVMVLSRIDTGFLAVGFTLVMVIESLRRSASIQPHHHPSHIGTTLTQVAVIAICALLVTLPWWWYNASVFGSIMPISGQSQHDLSGSVREVIVETVNVIADALIPSLHTPVTLKVDGIAWPGIVLVTALLIGLAIPASRTRIRSFFERYRRDWNLRPLLPLGLHAAFLLIFYTLFFQAPHFQSRYLLPLTLLVTLVHVSLWVSGLRHSRSSISRMALYAIFFLFQILSLGLFYRNYSGQGASMMLEVQEWVSDSTTSTERIGMFQSGTLGYLHPTRVTNLDGKVNARALHATRSGRLPLYADSLRFDYIIDWDVYTRRIFIDQAVRRRYQPIDTLNNHMVVWKRLSNGS